jgi:heat shock protein HslJ
MHRITQLVVFLVVASACSASEAIPEEIDLTGNWQLLSGSVDGEALPLIDGSPVTLNITGTELGGSSACNSYGGHFILDGASISIGDLVSTLMMCGPEAMDVEVPYLEALRKVDTVAVDGDELTLTGPGIELRYSAVG